MKNIVVVFVMLAAMLAVVSASAKQSKIKQYIEGTVIRVDKHEGHDQVAIGENPSDAPLADPESFAYDVAVRAGCGTYVGRYRSWYDYLPSVFTEKQKLQLRLTRSVMYVNVPNEKEVELRIISRHVERGPCEIASR